MATANHTTSPITQNTCRVVAARNRMDGAGENDDVGYNAAMADIETLPATSPAGIAAKFDALCWYLDTIETLALVDDYVSWESIEALRAGIKAGLTGLQRS